jgi:hypothetical protein
VKKLDVAHAYNDSETCVLNSAAVTVKEIAAAQTALIAVTNILMITTERRNS